MSITKTIPENHKGIKAYIEGAGNCRISEVGGGGACDLSQEQFTAYQKARLMADSKNGSDWSKAWETLEKAGFIVFWV